LIIGIFFVSCSEKDDLIVPPQNNPPIISIIPDQNILEGQFFTSISLDQYVDDPDNTDSQIIWTTDGQNELSVSISADRIADIIIPSENWTGSELIIFTATDPGGECDYDSVIFAVSPVEFTPLDLDDWEISTPEAEGLDPRYLKELYRNAIMLEREYEDHLYSVLVIKNGYLIAERYFAGRSYNHATASASVTKCYTSVLVGLALLQDNVLSSLDQQVYGFFPEYDWDNTDPRKKDITIRQMLQMRSGFPWEEREGYMDDFASTSDWLSLMLSFPLTSDPGTIYGYSNLSAHVLAVIAARATNSQLSTFAQTYLFDPLGVTAGYWPQDAQGNNAGHGDLRIRPRDMAKFGQLTLNDGLFNGAQIVPVDWVTESTTPYSFNIFGGEILYSFQQINYGYCWETALCGDHNVTFAWGHGGQLIVIARSLNMVVVATADNLLGDFTPEGWGKESAVLDLVGYFIGSITE